VCSSDLENDDLDAGGDMGGYRAGGER